MTFALAGNQNCGKTTLFNRLTGANQRVGNFPGVTVERKSGRMRGYDGVEVVDLPGIYSIRPFTGEENVARDFLLDGKPDCIINIADATNIERNLYLTLQLMALETPMVLALNMMDELTGNRGHVDCGSMSKRLGIPVVPVSAIKNEGVKELAQIAIDLAKSGALPEKPAPRPEGPVFGLIDEICGKIGERARVSGIPVRFAAEKLIEGDDMTAANRLGLDKDELESVEAGVCAMEKQTGLDRNAAIARARYDFIESVCRECVTKPRESRERLRSDAIDRVLTEKRLAIPIFVAVMASIFYLTFSAIGPFLSKRMACIIDLATDFARAGLVGYGMNPLVISLAIDGVFEGVGSVLSFLPVIVTLFFFLSVLEDTGYMARVAFLMDRPLRKLGLSGKSAAPLLMGFGCTVPAVMATRTLSTKRDRTLTALLTPFMSCSAKIPIYAVFSAAFFPEMAGLVMISMYVIGVLTGAIAAKVLGRTVFRGTPAPFVMELPDYRFPSSRSVLLLMRERAKDFLVRAFTVIFVATVAVWFFKTFDSRLNAVRSNSASMLAGLGRIIAPVFNPLGFGDWRSATALISGFIAKESVVSTLGVLLGSANLPGVLPALFTPEQAFSFLTFTLLYTPCAAATGVIRREVSSGAGAVAVVFMQCAIAWLAAYIVAVICRIFA